MLPNLNKVDQPWFIYEFWHISSRILDPYLLRAYTNSANPKGLMLSGYGILSSPSGELPALLHSAIIPALIDFSTCYAQGL
jgi:hypothetical protein